MPLDINRGVLYENTAESVKPTRAMVRTILTAWEYDEDTIETAQLIASELSTNAVVHARRSKHFRLVCYTAITVLIIGIADEDHRPPLMAAATTEDEGGRGLMLVEALADEWYWEPLPGGKIVFACLRVERPLQAKISHPLVLT